jgi:hypothetical protein
MIQDLTQSRLGKFEERPLRGGKSELAFGKTDGPPTGLLHQSYISATVKGYSSGVLDSRKGLASVP